MKVCKYCGKEFESTPLYCTRCGAVDDFLVRKKQTDEEGEDYLAFFGEDKAKGNEEEKQSEFLSGFGENTSYVKSHRKAESIDDLLGAFTDGEEEADDSQRLYEKYAEDPTGSFLRPAKKEEKIDPYYSSLDSVLGGSPISEKDKDFYEDLETMLDSDIKSADETTFNGLFRKEDTMENTFLKPQKKGRKVKKVESDEDSMTLRGVKIKKKKLIKVAVGLTLILGILAVALVFMINSIVKSDNKGSELPAETAITSFFTDVRSVDEATFLANPVRIDFSSYQSTEMNEAKKAEVLPILYQTIAANDFQVKSVQMESKGSDRILANFTITGNANAQKLFQSLLFIKGDDGRYNLDFNDFVIQYNKKANMT